MPRSNLREKYTFKTQQIGLTLNGLSHKKGYCGYNNISMGPTIFYNLDGTLYAAGSYDPNIFLGRDRKIDHWKYYTKTGTLRKEEIFIK